jgi:hypothetical protein
MNGNQQEFNVKEIASEEPKKLGEKFKFQKKHLKIGLGIIIVLILAFTVITFLKGWFSFSKSNVSLDIISPAEISSGEEIEFIIRYQNNNRVALKDAKLIIDYPQGVYSLEGEELTQEARELGTIPSKKGGAENFKIRLTGEKGSIKLLASRLNYQPANINSHFENFASFKMNISSVLIGAYLTAPQKAINGEEITYILDYINNSDQDFSNVRVELNYPSGFTYKTAEPLPVSIQEGGPLGENNIWQIEELKKGERETVRISGILEGIDGENKTLGVSIGEVKNDKFLKYSQTTAVTQISSSPLIVTLSLNDKEEEINVDAKDVLNYKIEFKNNTDIALSQLILKAYLRGGMFNFRSVKLAQKGFFDSLNNVITWSAAGVPSLTLLPPGESGSVNFSVAVNDNFPVSDFNDKNFQISVQAELETLNVPPQFSLERLKVEKILKSKVNSQVILRAKGYYNETTANITNFGPIPPKVNQVTTYTIHWQITNTSNDLENVRVTAILPEGIEWRNVYTTLNKGTTLEYNERTKQIVWNIDKIPAATGFLIPAYELVFQIALRPSITQVGTSPVLIDESRLEGKDTFTGEVLEAFSPAIATDLPDDLTVTAKLGEVVE